MNEFNIRINEKVIEVKIVDDLFVEVNNIKYAYSLILLEKEKYLLRIGTKFFEISYTNPANNDYNIQINNHSVSAIIRTSLEEKAYQLLSQSQSLENHKTIVKSPMPGLVLKINRSIGDKVSKGETVLILEAMKMENEIKSPVDGILFELNIEQGKAIEKNKILFSIK
ncbi:MAG: acetyl-CoA carboxylase biotin carboxyl carrier protein subunit [Ignavibacteriales bacterium]|jgi:biotin carboxyl carrier protein|nr:acetyl-CoA carboxylase biotin carboxyl carrier protein subunit [Ignavibacteriales bacterium]